MEFAVRVFNRLQKMNENTRMKIYFAVGFIGLIIIGYVGMTIADFVRNPEIVWNIVHTTTPVQSTIIPTRLDPSKTPMKVSTPKPSHPSGATAICKDGTYSYSTEKTGSCSGHDGVRQWLP